MQEKPLLSIITVNLNNLEGLKKTMASVFEQTWQELEYIIIDGDSTDGSREYIEIYSDKIDYWVSEKDAGIYNAMNKGIDEASGEYLLFLNSGDYLVNNLVLNSLINFKPTEDIVYGNSLIQRGEKLTVKIMPVINTLAKSLTNTVNHQTIFFNRKLFADGSRYNCDYKIVADWVFINEAIRKKNIRIRHIDLIVPCFNLDGFSSDKNARIREREVYIETTFDRDFRALLNNYINLERELTDFKNKTAIKFLFRIKKTYNVFKSKI